jgi:N-acetylmuramoyl-L-alanine amidase
MSQEHDGLKEALNQKLVDKGGNEMIKRIAVDTQHMGKPHKPADRGGSYNGYQEAYLALRYATLVFQELTSKGYEAFLITSGTYTERHAWINKHNIDLYLACHLNAGGGRYSLVEHYYDAGRRTREIAKIMAENFKTILNTSDGKVWEIPKGGRGAVCLSGTRPSALLLEPLFIDNDRHLHIAVSQPKLIAEAIIKTIESYNLTIT